MAYYLGIDLGGTNIAVGVVDENYQIIGRGKNKTRVPCSSEEMCEQLAVTAFAALEDAGVKEGEATGIRVKKERDDGRTVYVVTVYVDAEEYSYEIDADTGDILQSDYEVDKDYDREPDNPDYLTREEVTEIVLEKVEGATEMDVRVTYEVDDGHEKYEGSIFYDQTEYEFEVNAQNGDIIEWSEEKFD